MTDVLDHDRLFSNSEIVPQESTTSTSIGKMCPECGATKSDNRIPFMTNAQLAAHRRHKHGVAGTSEKAKREGGARGKARRESIPKAPAAAKPPAKPAPRPSAGRKSTADFFTKNVTRLSKVFATMVSVPGGRAWAFSAPAIGPAIDGLIAGTRIDKPVQRIATVSDKWEAVGDAFGLPLMVTLCDLNPMFIPIFEDDMRDALEGVMIASIPALKKKRERQAKVTDAMAELQAIDPALAQMSDPIGALLQGFFAPVDSPNATEEPPVAEPATTDAR